MYQQQIGIAMGTNCAPSLANLYLFYYEYQFLQRAITRHCSLRTAITFQRVLSMANFSRYIDDAFLTNFPWWLAEHPV
jgi:hypothetical protein